MSTNKKMKQKLAPKIIVFSILSLFVLIFGIGLVYVSIRFGFANNFRFWTMFIWLLIFLIPWTTNLSKLKAYLKKRKEDKKIEDFYKD